MDYGEKPANHKEFCLIRRCAVLFSMKALNDEKCEKILEKNKNELENFFKFGQCVFAVKESFDAVGFTAPSKEFYNLDALKQKCIMVIKTRKDIEYDNDNAIDNIVLMEFTKHILDNLSALTHDVFHPMLSNPKNQVGWSDLVTKDLMDKFNFFLSQVYVTIGQVKGRTLLPLPASDITTDDNKSNKDKAHILESSIITWTRQIKNVLKQDPESALKAGNNPGPHTEINFWKHKADNLNSIHKQLQSDRIKKVIKFLEQNKSTYTSPFGKLQKEVSNSRTEANDNFKYLATLEKLFDQLTDETAEFMKLQDLFVPIMHTVLLIWKHSSYYNNASKLVVLVREICNAIIDAAFRFINGEQIFGLIKAETPKEAFDKLSQTLDICSKFKEAFFEYKGRAKEGQNGWRVTTNALFVRLDSFADRCQDIMNLTQTIIQFKKLEKIEIGGTKGHGLTETIKDIGKEFNNTIENFQMVEYDIMDINEKKPRFDDDFFKFKSRIKELERRLASVLTQGFDDSDTIIGKFKLLDSFEGILTRPIIQDELEKKHITLLELYKQDLKIVQSIFLEGKALVDKVDERAPIADNMAPITGAIYWTTGLYERIKEPMDKLSTLSQVIQDREEYKDVQKLYASLKRNLKEFDDSKIAVWEEIVDSNTEGKLDMQLLTRDDPLKEEDDGFLNVNFDPLLVRLLREVKYLGLLGKDVPEKAQLLYAKVAVYRTQSGNLDLIVGMYNEILATLLPVEKPLLAKRISTINEIIEPGIVDLKWNREQKDIDPFIDEAMDYVSDIDALVKKMKDNVKEMQKFMSGWAKEPLFERKNKPMLPDDLQQTHESIFEPKLGQIKDDGKEIHKKMKDTMEAIRPDKKSQQWLDYQDYVNSLIVEGMTTAICSSMDDLAHQINFDHNKEIGVPMFDVKIDLIDEELNFDPPISIPDNIDDPNDRSIKSIIFNIAADFIKIGREMVRIDTGSGDYICEIKDQFAIYGSLSKITKNFKEMEHQCDVYIHQYEEFSFLWKENLDESFKAFIESGSMPLHMQTKKKKKHQDEEEEEQEHDEEEEDDESFGWFSGKILTDVQVQKPKLEEFDEKITYLNMIKNKIDNLSTSKDLGWLKINSKPLKERLKAIIATWINKYTNFLLENTLIEIFNIKNFISEVSDGIKVVPEKAESKNEKDVLMKVMTHLRDVTMIKDHTKNEFEPMKQTVLLLKKHGADMKNPAVIEKLGPEFGELKEELLLDLENSKTKLEEVAETALGPVRAKIQPLQNQEAQNIKADLQEFEQRIKDFRKDFKANNPYHTEVATPEVIQKSYDVISKYYDQMIALEKEARDFNNLETLFELQKSSYKALKECRNELIQLKYMWDLISLVEFLFSSWRSTLWDKIDTENLLAQIKEMQKKSTNPLTPQNKEVKNWKAFKSLNERVQNMNTILPLISELHSKYMMDRHWRRLMTITGKDINFASPTFCLEDLIALELYKYSDEVTELVDSANKEARIETNLNKIEAIWETEKLEFVEYQDTFVIGPLDETIEFVETHSMELMGMLSQKDVEEFKERVLRWQKTLKQVDAILTIWIKVQKNWQRLEPIFLQSEDIKAQLPDDTKRFQGVDSEWKDLMRDAAEDAIAVNACTAEGRLETLNEFFTSIETCEKSLNDYLEQKKKIFPRFYFVSNQALLTILSNGNKPDVVGRFLGDCFDGMKAMDWAEEADDKPKPWKTSKGMYSKEDEYVPFDPTITFEGAVENYLNELQEKMRVTLGTILVQAKTTADNWEIEKKRHEWLDDYCAQISLLTTQIIWTEEVRRVFDEVESGSETAMKEYLDLSVRRIADLISRVRLPLDKLTRTKIITIITIDVHARDVIEKFVLDKTVDPTSFAWQRQLKFSFEKKLKTDEFKACYPEIADWSCRYLYEYVGNCGRLVITPLTDRCYITLTQALNLTMGGAPAGPAGTGKTETTKDLGRALGIPVYVFNCSDQMNYQSMGQIFMGLAQTGSWGCFDEFNRIAIEVLSVVSTQIKTCLDALRNFIADPKRKMFLFMDEEINIEVTVGFFITMNPGYAGRTELPENLKALFRSCAMVVPDIILICENMLMSEGFDSAKELSKKFMTLYDLCKSLLSKQIHYDWGLRAVKSVLRQAGQLKRDSPDLLEDLILMRALRDFNVPKIITDDIPIFLGLIDALFPELEIESVLNPELEVAVRKVAVETGLQAEDGFVGKCVNMAEILQVRHSMFIIGNPGSGKSTVWKTLALAENSLGREVVSEIIDPKAVTSDELFGWMNPKTKEWRDGVLAVIMRNMANNLENFKETQSGKWIILDGDVDPEWIESCNTVMDDNKMLTLVSQERIRLTDEMRLVLEVSNLRNATPATVSRGGVLYINDNDIGWKPFVDSWMDQFKNTDEIARTVFELCFRNYVSESFLEDTKTKETIAPMVEIAYIQTLTCVIDHLYLELKEKKDLCEYIKKLREEDEEGLKVIFEAFFIFAFMWSFGSALPEDLKQGFSNSVKAQAKSVKFPESKDLCFQFFYDVLEGTWVNWSDKVEKFEYDEYALFDSIVVPTTDTIKNRYIMDIHVARKKPLLYIGTAGTAKTTYIKDYFKDVDKETTVTATINFNSYTDSKALQTIMEDNVDKRAGKTFGPPPNHVLIYFMDDLNMPLVDGYGTQSPIALIRQLLDYDIMYNREALEEKKYLVDVLYTACLNPKAGSFFVDPRLQRHYSVIACDVPTDAVLDTIFLQIVDSHLSKFDVILQKLAPKIIKATATVFRKMVKDPSLRPTAKKFHYQFNLRDFAKIIKNFCLSSPVVYKGQPEKLARLWVHECHRVYLDRLLFDKDKEIYLNAIKEGSKALEVSNEELFTEPNIFTSFISSSKGHEKLYQEIEDVSELKGVLEDKLRDYNENVSSMNLVLFLQAMEHVCRISRIIDQPSGNALLIGVGGSGKQSLSKLSAHILEYEVFRIMPNASYGMNELRTDLETMYTKAGVAGTQVLFLLTDTQIVNEMFLVYINDMLSSGWVPEMFPKEELDLVLGKVRSEAKSQGYQDTPDQLFEFLLEKTQRNLHVALCFSPVGDSFRVRARKFPGIINCTQIDWFHEWPEEALIDVASRFLKDLEMPNEEIRENIALHMAFIHTSIEEANQDFLIQERRYNYTTPTSYLELINFYKSLLQKKQSAIKNQSERLQIGLETMVQTTVQVDKLKEELVETMVKVKEEQRVTNELIEKVTHEKGIAAGEQEKANTEAEATEELASKAGKIKGEADQELEEALPAMQRAQEAVDCLEPKSIQEMKSFAKPHESCKKVATVALVLIKNEKKNYAWNNAQKMMGNPNKFLDEVKGFNGDDIDEWKLKKIAPILADPAFTYEAMTSISIAAANLCKWAINIIEYNTIYKKVKPLMDKAAEAEEEVTSAKAKLEEVNAFVAECNAKVAGLQAELDAAVAKKEAVEAEAAGLQDKLDLAERLVNGLADENKRWKENVSSLGNEKLTMIGDALLSSAFVSYIAPFSAKFRNILWKEKWLDDVKAKKIPITEGVDPLYVLATLSDQAVWKKEGLPADRVSLENASIVTSCSRWPLMIDPQLQGIKWVREREGSDLKVIQLNQPKWINVVEQAVQLGNTLLIEGATEEIDAMLDPLLSRAIIKKGKNNFVIKLGSEEIDYDPKFKLYIQTKLSNPHYKPETAAQCTIINFIVTESGLEDQLLALVVQEEKPELEQTKSALVKEQNEFMITLAKLEEELLTNLSNADPETILDNKELIESLENTKATSQEIQEKKAIAAKTEIQINESRNVYRRVASEGSMLYFLLIQLYVVDHMYQYSLESFTTFFFKAFEKAEEFEDGEDEKRVLALRGQIRNTIYQWVARGLFERHKQILLCQIVFRLMNKKILDVEYSQAEFSFLINGPQKIEPNPNDWLPDLAWGQIQKLIEIEGFESLAKDIEKEAPGRFQDWYNELEPENEKLPLDWKKLESQPFQKLLVIRCLRPDRLTVALNNFISRTLPDGSSYVNMDSTSGFEEVLYSSLGNSTTTTPIFFVLSAGANPVKDVETIGRRMNIDMSKQFHFIALGQGQEENAMDKLELGHKEGHWVMLENIHLMPRWLPELEKKLDDMALEGSNPSFRVFLSAEPNIQIPIGILERSIKLTNEPPTGLKANMKQAFVSFRPEEFNEKDSKVKTILFALCYFHAVLIERRKFGAKGWNMHYPFSMGDLRDSARVLQGYMDRNQGAKIPWDDLKYIFGEIMYGGHIVDDWDRILCMSYLEYLLGEHLFDEAELLPYVEGKGISFKVPPVLPYEKYIEHIDFGLPGDTPLLFGMHSNTEIDFRTMQSTVLMKTMQELQPADEGNDEEGGTFSKTDKAIEIIGRLNDEVNIDGNKPNLEDITSKLGEERNPYQNVFVQECEYMSNLIDAIQKSIFELQLAFKGELTMTDLMEQLMECMFLDRVPPQWSKLAYPSTRGLSSWLENLKLRLEQINRWKEDPSEIPKVIFLNRLFNPQSFLTAIKQKYSQDNKAPLNKLYIKTDVTKKMFDVIEDRAKDGAYVFGFHIDGARWDINLGQLEESWPKKPYSVMPVIHCRAHLIQENKKEDKSVFQCPIYATDARSKTYVFTAQFRTKAPPHKWILGGVSGILDVEGVADQANPEMKQGQQSHQIFLPPLPSNLKASAILFAVGTKKFVFI